MTQCMDAAFGLIRCAALVDVSASDCRPSGDTRLTQSLGGGPTPESFAEPIPRE